MSPGHGHPATLQASHPGNAHRGRHGIRSPRMRDPRAQEVAEAIMVEPHTAGIDVLGAEEIGRLQTYIEALDAEIDRVGMAGSGQRQKWLGDLRLRASRNLMECLDRFGATPKGRATWARELAQGGLAAEIAARRRASAAPPGCRQTRGGGEALRSPRAAAPLSSTHLGPPEGSPVVRPPRAR